MDVLVYQMHTIPDIESGVQLFGLTELSDADVVKAMCHIQKSRTGSEQLPSHLKKIVAISAIALNKDELSFHSIATPEQETDILMQFFHTVKRIDSPLVSWQNGKLFQDILQHRALLHGVANATYWQRQSEGRAHVDLQEVISPIENPQLTLETVATWLKIPSVEDDIDTWDLYQKGDHKSIEQHCQRTCVINYFIYLRVELIRGNLSAQAYQSACQMLQSHLKRISDGS